MRTNILLAVDVAPGSPGRHVAAAASMTAELVRDSADSVIVLHVREFSVPRLARTMAGHGGSAGRAVVDEIVTGLRARGIHASGLVREADFGHVAETILAAAGEFDARLIVLGSRGRTDLPRTPSGGVAGHLLRHATLPVLLAPAGHPERQGGPAARVPAGR